MKTIELKDSSTINRSHPRVETPVIDAARLLANDARILAAESRKVLDACHSHGYFTVINTGIEQSLVDAVILQSNTLFALADDDPIKLAVHSGRTAGGMGWSELFNEPAYTPGTLAHMESFDCGPYRAHIEQVKNAAELGLYPSAWPDIEGFRSAVRDYWDRQHLLGNALYRAFADALAVSERFFDSRCGPAAPSTLRLIHYPENDLPADRKNVGISEHSDFECFTVIYQSAPGLELLDTNDTWVTAPVEPGHFIVMIGDMLERWSNGFLTATRHRVPNTSWTRNSIVMFFAANADCVVQPLKQYVNSSNPARFDPVTQAEHIAHEIEKAEDNRLTLSQAAI